MPIATLSEKYATAREQLKAPTFRIWIDDNAMINAVCGTCEANGRARLGSFQDRAEWGMGMIRLNMAEHAAVYHTHR